jgi:hypothetical protein
MPVPTIQIELDKPSTILNITQHERHVTPLTSETADYRRLTVYGGFSLFDIAENIRRHRPFLDSVNGADNIKVNPPATLPRPENVCKKPTIAAREKGYGHTILHALSPTDGNNAVY